MSLTLLVVIAVLAVVVLALVVKILRDSTVLVEMREERDETNRELRSLREKFQATDERLERKRKEAQATQELIREKQEAEDSKRKAKRARKKAVEEQRELESVNQKLSKELKELRIKRERERQELESVRERIQELELVVQEVQTTRLESEVKSPQSDEVEVVAPKKQHSQHEDKLARDVDRLKKTVRKLEDMAREWKNIALKNAADAKQLGHRLRNAETYSHITQSQLDHALDEVYFLKHGKTPDMPRANKSKKRAALKPKEPQVEIISDEVVILPDLADDLKASEDKSVSTEAEAALSVEAKDGSKIVPNNAKAPGESSAQEPSAVEKPAVVAPATNVLESETKLAASKPKLKKGTAKTKQVETTEASDDAPPRPTKS